MKHYLFTPLFFLSILLLSCTEEESFSSSYNTQKESIIISEEIQETYNEFIDRLKRENVGKNIYYGDNFPDVSDEVEKLQKQLKASRSTNEVQATMPAVTYGPWGGNGGTPFDARAVLYPGETWKKLTAIKIRSGRLIDAIQLYWVNDKGEASNSPQFGKNGGTEQWIFLQPSEHITGVVIRHGRLIDNLTFITNYSVYSFGGTGGTSTSLNFGISGYQLHGIFGRADRLLDNIGLYCYSNELFPVY